MYKLLFFDHEPEKAEAYRRIIQSTASIPVEVVCQDVNSLIESQLIHILVSPANSYGVMDGGIDDVYQAVFPDIEAKVQTRIQSFGILTSRGDAILPIGSAIFVSTRQPAIKVLACVPTMETPRNIVGTYNVYWAMRGLLKILDKLRAPGVSITVALPCFGTGVGGMSPDRSAEQIADALNDHERNNLSICDPSIASVEIVTRDDEWAYVLSDHACPQPQVNW